MIGIIFSNLRPHAKHYQRYGWVLVAALALLALSNPYANAQLTTADIIGTVSDSTGAIIPNAKVNLLNLGTHESRSTLTGATGTYAFTLLPPGHYSVQIEAQGFKHAAVPDLTVAAGDRARADATLQIGQSSETVQVTAQTPLLQTDSSTVSSSVSDQAVQNLPLNGRNFIQLVQLVPGANEGPGNGLTSGGRPDDRRPTNGFSVNGQDDTLNNQVIDGIDNNERVIGTIGVKPSIDAIQEITVQTNNYAPEIGRTAGGVVNIITKSGTNNFHGSAYEFLRNDKLDARNFFSQAGVVPKAELRQNQFGGSLGGPIVRNKTFFFGDYEGLRTVSGGTTYTSTVPTLAQYNDIHSLNGGSPQHLVSQGNGTAGYSVDPVALNYLMLFPAPNVAGATVNNYIINPSKTQYSTTVDVRIDHQFNSNNQLSGRYTLNNVSTNTPAQLPAAANGIIAGGGKYNFAGQAKDTANQLALNYSHTFNPNVVLALRAAYTRINNASYPLNYGTNADTKVGFGSNMNFNQLTSGLTPISITGFPDLGDGAYVPLQDIDNTFQYDGSISYHIRNHDLKFGAGLIRRQARNIQSAFPFGEYAFGLTTDATPAQILASTLVGGFTLNNPARSYDLYPPDYRSWEPSVYGQDNWKTTRWLTLTLGARYDVFTPFTEAHNHISNFDFNQALALASTGADVSSALKVAGVNGVSSTAGIKTDYSNLAPRIGFAATIRPGLVVRGGYGLSFFPGNYTSNADLKNAPYVSVYSPNCQSTIAHNIEIAVLRSQGKSTSGVAADCATQSLPATFDAGLPFPAPQNIHSPALSFVAVDPHLRSALVQQFNLLVEKQFGPNVLSVGYVGSLGEHLPETLNDINEPAPGGTVRALNNVLPNLNGVNWLMSEGISNYNGLQMSFERRYQNGLTFNTNYTYSHTLSDVTGFSEEGQQGWSDADPFHIRQYEYSNAENDIRNRFVGTVTYVLPFAKGFSGVRKLLLDGWQPNAIMAWQSGKPFTVVNSGNAGGYGNRAHPYNGINGGVDRPDQIHSATLSNPSLHEWFDVTAFQPQALGTVGSERRNALVGPHFRHVDLSLFKDFPIRESMKLQFRTEVFNLSNTPNLFINNNVNSSPSTLLGNSSFGQVTQTDPNYTPRQYQFALKLMF